MPICARPCVWHKTHQTKKDWHSSCWDLKTFIFTKENSTAVSERSLVGRGYPGDLKDWMWGTSAEHFVMGVWFRATATSKREKKNMKSLSST